MRVETSRAPRRWVGVLLWVIALALMLGAAAYQRLTGPTHPMRGTLLCEEEPHRYRLPRSGTSGEPSIVRLPSACRPASATLHWRRYPSSDAFRAVPFESVETGWQAALPTQPAAGKVEYTVTLRFAAADSVTLPTRGDPPVLRFKDPVPLIALIPHVAMMFLSMLFGVRAALAAVLGRSETRWLVPLTTLGLAAGGLVLGPIVQKYAFGAYWTGWPLGGDLTDNKTLAMWVAWAIATLVVVRGRDVLRARVRLAVLAAAVVMLAVYLVPHSLRGSQLDYEALDSGVRAEDAIRTGRPQ